MSGSLAVALLVGGRSTRMGIDKAFLDWGGMPLWKHQLRTLHALDPDETFLCIGDRTDFDADGTDVRLLRDDPLAKGPMAGIAAALAAMGGDRLVVLAVDLPEMTADFLRGMVLASADGAGRCVERAGYYEGLAAVYGKELSELAGEIAGGSDPSVQHFVRRAVAAGALKTGPVPEQACGLFRNLNSARD